jgi:hypothetical protein
MQLKYNGGDVLSNIYTHREPTGSFLLISHGSGVVPKGVLSIYMYVCTVPGRLVTVLDFLKFITICALCNLQQCAHNPGTSTEVLE